MWIAEREEEARMKMVRRIARILSLCSTLLGLLTLIRPRSGFLSLIVWFPKALAEACAPLLAGAGSLSAVMGLAARDRWAFSMGVAGAVIAGRHVVHVSAAHREFERAFGEGWERRIPVSLKERMLPARWSPRAKAPPVVPWGRDIQVGINYESGLPLLADIWCPPQGVMPTRLGVIYLHGSGWHYTDKDMHTRHFFRHLAGQGHLILDLAYTLAPRDGLRSMMSDVKQAIAWLKTHSAQYIIDPDRIVLIGASAGGHLALLAAYTADHPAFQLQDIEADTSVRAVVSYYGPTDLFTQQEYFESWFPPLLSRNSRRMRSLIRRVERAARHTRLLPDHGQLVEPRDLLPNVIGAGLQEAPGEYRFWSPITHAGKDCPPTLLLQGKHDFAVPVADVRRLHRALLAHGATSILVEFEDTEHAFDLLFPRWSPAAQAATYDVERFLALMM
jgi:acetyl esterase/lipase